MLCIYLSFDLIHQHISNLYLSKINFYNPDIKINAAILGTTESEPIYELLIKNKSGDLACGTLVANPIPKSEEIPGGQLSSIIEAAYEKASKQKIDGKKLTPFLLKEISERTEGKSLEANKALALNNVKLGAEIAKSIV